MGKSDQWAPPIPDDIWDGRTGRGVRVAVIDSGVDTDHPSLQGKVKGSVEAHAQNGQINFRRSTTGDSAGHGTACASIITTIAPDVELYSIKVLGAKASGTGDVFLSGFEYAIKQRMQVINLSLGTTKRELFGPLHDLLDKAYQLGCIVVAAANNLPQPSFPSIFSSSVVSVIKKEGTDPFSFGYRYGEVIEISAPGVGVRAAWPGGGYRTLTGNSFACPHVVGLIALLLEAYPDLTPFQVKTILHAVARKNQKETIL
ncbi:MAG TPA: S8 family serine peptidase [Pyrinomonadaceae bacterium]|nr:S8 family serine peptidase [Pyrinomonadaceae bacterium]